MSSSTRSGRVLAIARTLIWAIIAVALVKFAFFPANGDDTAESLNPDADYSQITVTPTKADITNTVRAKGTVQSDPSVTVKASGEGEVTYIGALDGTAVESGTPILEVRKEIPGETTTSVDAEGTPQMQTTPTTYSYTTIYANATGTLRLNALIGQRFSIGDPVATIQPSTFSAFATLNADQLYRIQNAPGEATLTITNGPAPFTCSGLEIVTPEKTTKSEDQNNQQNTQTGIQAKCPIPADQTVFPGLQLTMEIVSGQASQVLTLPVSAVEGRFQSGYVYLVGEEGAKPQKHPVKLGITDGKIVEITEGLSEADAVLEFTPSAKKDNTKRDSDTDDLKTPIAGNSAATSEADA